MSQFTRFFSGKFQNLGNCAGVKNLTNIMSVASTPKTQCKDEFRNLSGCVPEILTASRIDIISF